MIRRRRLRSAMGVRREQGGSVRRAMEMRGVYRRVVDILSRIDVCVAFLVSRVSEPVCPHDAACTFFELCAYPPFSFKSK